MPKTFDAFLTEGKEVRPAAVQEAQKFVEGLGFRRIRRQWKDAKNFFEFYRSNNGRQATIHWDGNGLGTITVTYTRSLQRP